MPIVLSTRLNPSPRSDGSTSIIYQFSPAPVIANSQYYFDWPNRFQWGDFRPAVCYVRTVGDPFYVARVYVSDVPEIVRGNDAIVIPCSGADNLIIELDAGKPLQVEIRISDRAEDLGYFRRDIYSRRFAPWVVYSWRGKCLSDATRLLLDPDAGHQIGGGGFAPGTNPISNFLTWDGWSGGGALELAFTFPAAGYIAGLSYRIGIVATLADYRDTIGAGPFYETALRVGKITTWSRAPTNLDPAQPVKDFFDTARVGSDNPAYLDSLNPAGPSFYIPVAADARWILPASVFGPPLTPTADSVIYFALQYLTEGELF